MTLPNPGLADAVASRRVNNPTVHEKMRNPPKRKPQSVGDNEAFVDLLCAAQDDREFRATVCGVLRQPGFHRNSMLNTMIANMSADGVKEGVIRAVSALTDDAVAARALELLEEGNGQPAGWRPFRARARMPVPARSPE